MADEDTRTNAGEEDFEVVVQKRIDLLRREVQRLRGLRFSNQAEIDKALQTVEEQLSAVENDVDNFRTASEEDIAQYRSDITTSIGAIEDQVRDIEMAS